MSESLFFFVFAVSTTFPVPWVRLMCCIINTEGLDLRYIVQVTQFQYFYPPGGEDHICNVNVKAGENNARCHLLLSNWIQDPFLCGNESDMNLIWW